MLNVLPPAVMDNKGFMVGEPWDHDELDRPRFSAFIRMDGKYLESQRPMTVRDYKGLQRAQIEVTP